MHGMPSLSAGPESPEVVSEVAFESPEVALASGFASASPESPVSPDVAVGLARRVAGSGVAGGFRVARLHVATPTVAVALGR